MNAHPRPPHDDDAGADADALSLLHAAWAALPTPDATPRLADEDVTTRATVDWLRRAWDELPVSAAPSAPLAAHARIRRPGRRLDVARYAAAAAILVGVALALVWAVRDGAPRDRAPAPVAEAPVETRASDPSTLMDAAPRPDVPVPGAGAAEHPSADTEPPLLAQFVSAGDDRIVTRAGNVRLVLLTNSTVAAASPSPTR